MKKYFVLILAMFLFFFSFSQSKDKKFFLNGYISQMSQTIIDSIDGNWINDGLIHNRMMFNYFGIRNFTFNFEIRNRIFYGESVKYIPNYGKYIDSDRGFIDLSYNVADRNSFVFNTLIDRLFLQYEIGKFKATLGRQRINWGTTFVWNPNDLFNNYSFFDFDYAEKPGSDALYLQYFRNYASSIEFAAKINSDTAFTFAGKYAFNAFQYDFQIIGGILDSEDMAVGGGWSGNIKQLAFRGETTYLQPIKNFFDTTGTVLASIGVDYLFLSGFMITGEFLYNHSAGNLNVINFYDIQLAPASLKNLSFAKYNAVLQLSYPVSPIINTSLAFMYMDLNNWIFFSPNIGFSISQNVDFSIVGQIFAGKMQNPITQNLENITISIVYMRLKYSF